MEFTLNGSILCPPWTSHSGLVILYDKMTLKWQAWLVKAGFLDDG